MDTEERLPTQPFHVPVLEVEGLMPNYSRGVDKKLVVRSIFGYGIDERFIIVGICDREIGQSSDADGWRLSDGSFWCCTWAWVAGRSEWKW